MEALKDFTVQELETMQESKRQKLDEIHDKVSSVITKLRKETIG